MAIAARTRRASWHRGLGRALTRQLAIQLPRDLRELGQQLSAAGGGGVEGMVERDDEVVRLLDDVKALFEAVLTRHRGTRGVGRVAGISAREVGRHASDAISKLL